MQARARPAGRLSANATARANQRLRARQAGIVTGPSLTSSTCMSAPNSPAATGAWRSRATGAAPRRRARGPAPAARRPRSSAGCRRGVGGQRELADDQQAAVHVLHAAVHLAGVVGEDAQLQQLVDQLVGLHLGVAGLGAHEAPAGPRPMRADCSRRRSSPARCDTRCTSASIRSGPRCRRSAPPRPSAAAGSCARRPGTALINACSTVARSAAARRSVQLAGMCMCRSTKRRCPARRVTTWSKRIVWWANSCSVRSISRAPRARAHGPSGHRPTPTPGARPRA